MYTKTDLNPHPNPKPNLNPSSATRQFLRIDGDDSAAHGELMVAVIESE